MEWQQLEYFQVLAQTQHFTRAAEILSISQPTLSRSISKLESELGVPLFERKGRGVILNHYGKLFYERTCRVLREISLAKQEITDLINPDHGSISFAFLKSLGVSAVPNLLSHFLEEYPLVHFKLYHNSRDVILNQLQTGEIDCGLTSTIELGQGMEWVKLWTEKMVVFVSTKHHLAHRESVSIYELANEKFIVLKEGTGSRTTFNIIFEQAGIIPEIAFEGDEPVSLFGFVSSNLGITLHPKIERFNLDNVKCLEIIEPTAEREIGIAWNKNSYISPVSRRFIQFLIGFYENRP